MAITAFPEEYSGEPPLAEKLRARIAARGPMPFREFMASALYDDPHGYYAGRSQRVGKDGDFITSVSVGRCFGTILAHRLERYWRSIGQPTPFQIIEPGAHDASLSLDILAEMKRSHPDFYRAASYRLVETTRHLRDAQAARLAPAHPGKFTVHRSLEEIAAATGALVSNELIDAFPVDLIRMQRGEWRLLAVEADAGDGFRFTPVPLPDSDGPLQKFCRELDELADFPEGYTTEFQPGLAQFASAASAVLEKGLFITIDYGLHAEDYYRPDRVDGTLQTYHRHQKSHNPLAAPGEIDITSHVDFTRLRAEAEAAGFRFNSLGTQSSYLTREAKDWLVGLEQSPSPGTPALLRQFQTLTHPAMLGSRFLVLEMEK